MKSFPHEYSRCDCDWLSSEVEALPPCGCGNPDCEVRLYRDDVIHWRGKHWKIRCAFEAAVKGTINPENPKQVPGERYYAICPSEGMSLMKSYPSLEAAMDRLTRYLRSFPRNVVGVNCRGWLIVGVNRWKPSREEIGKGYWVGE